MVKQVECEPLGARGVLWLGDFVKEPGRLVDPVLADVDVLLHGADGPAPAVGGDVQDPALLPDGVKREHFVDGYPENLYSSQFWQFKQENYIKVLQLPSATKVNLG